MTIMSWHADLGSVAKKQRRPVMCSTTSLTKELSTLTRLRTQRSSRSAHPTAAATLFCSMSLSPRCTSLPEGAEFLESCQKCWQSPILSHCSKGVFQLCSACCSGCRRADKKLWADAFPALQEAPCQEGAPTPSLCTTTAECPLRP